MVVSINQPAYLPWLGYFHRIAVSDLHVVLDHVQFEKNSFTNRNKIRTERGLAWVTVPVRTKGRFGDLAIRTLEIETTKNWRRKHWEAIRHNLAGAPFFAEHARFFEDTYRREWKYLAHLCTHVNGYLLEQFDIGTTTCTSSELRVEGAKDELVLNICRQVGATHYLSGPLGRRYLDEDKFTAAGIVIEYHDYQHPRYPQYRGSGFEAGMAAIDLLFNCGPRSGAIIGEGQPRLLWDTTTPAVV